MSLAYGIYIVCPISGAKGDSINTLLEGYGVSVVVCKSANLQLSQNVPLIGRKG
jgi:hypothetical protein